MGSAIEISANATGRSVISLNDLFDTSKGLGRKVDGTGPGLWGGQG